MNYGGDAADQIVRYSMEGMEHTLRISGTRKRLMERHRWYV